MLTTFHRDIKDVLMFKNQFGAFNFGLCDIEDFVSYERVQFEEVATGNVF